MVLGTGTGIRLVLVLLLRGSGSGVQTGNTPNTQLTSTRGSPNTGLGKYLV